jgi:hypothetical protein
VVRVTDPYGRILGILDRNCYFSFKWLLSCTHEAVDPVSDPLLRKCGSAGNRTQTSGSVARNPDH